MFFIRGPEDACSSESRLQHARKSHVCDDVGGVPVASMHLNSLFSQTLSVESPLWVEPFIPGNSFRRALPCQRSPIGNLPGNTAVMFQVIPFSSRADYMAGTVVNIRLHVSSLKCLFLPGLLVDVVT